MRKKKIENNIAAAEQIPLPVATETKEKKPRKKRVKKIEVEDFTKVKGTHIEYFDERFYRLSLPNDIDPSWIESIPGNYIFPSDTQESFMDVYMPSVTTIIGASQPNPGLMRWRGDVGNREADRRSHEALDKGSRIHKACELLTNGWAVIYQNLRTGNITDKEIRSFARKYKVKTYVLHEQEDMVQVSRYDRLIKTLQPEIKETESQVFNLKEVYAGTVDALWNCKGGEYKLGRNKIVLNDGLYIVDFKTGKWFQDNDYTIQLSAYAEAHSHKDKLQGVIIIHLNAEIKTGIEGLKCYVFGMDYLKPYFEQFRHLNAIYRFNNSDVIPRLYDIPQVLMWKK